jgi:hypothetical protein
MSSIWEYRETFGKIHFSHHLNKKYLGTHTESSRAVSISRRMPAAQSHLARSSDWKSKLAIFSKNSGAVTSKQAMLNVASLSVKLLSLADASFSNGRPINVD